MTSRMPERARRDPWEPRGSNPPGPPGPELEQKARTTAGIYKFSQADVESFAVPLPPSDEQCEIVERVEQRFSIVDEIEAQVDANLRRGGRLRQGILKRAFEGRLVPQDPSDEPAAELLERLRASRSVPARNRKRALPVGTHGGGPSRSKVK